MALNVVEIIIVQDYELRKTLMWMEIHICSVKAKSQAGNIKVKDIMTTQKGQSRKKICAES